MGKACASNLFLFLLPCAVHKVWRSMQCVGCNKYCAASLYKFLQFFADFYFVSLLNWDRNGPMQRETMSFFSEWQIQLSGSVTLWFSVARRFVSQYGVVRLSMGEALRTLLDTQPNTELARCILSFLHKGQTVPDELAVHALEVALIDTKCKTCGYVANVAVYTKVQWTALHSGLVTEDSMNSGLWPSMKSKALDPVDTNKNFTNKTVS